MHIRRCAVLWFEPREVARFELEDLLSGGTGIVSEVRWFAHAPHLPAAIEVGSDVARVVGLLSPGDWVEVPSDDLGDGVSLADMVAQGLVIAREDDAQSEARDADERFRAQHWYGLSAIWHAASRWSSLDAVEAMAELGIDTAAGLREKHGPPPPMLHERGDASTRVPLQRAEPTGFDALLDARMTCRNFDTTQALPLGELACVLERVFGARGRVQAADDFEVLKKTSPSGGALHPTEAYLIVQRVEGLASGLYHYRPAEHALHRLGWDGDTSALSLAAVAGQSWFADAHVLVILAPRFARNFWKYRNHPKAYRVAILDAGHLSQTLSLSATERGLGAFITAAINEVDLEHAFGLTSFVDGPLAVCGFGVRADAMRKSELDPNGKVWPRDND